MSARSPMATARLIDRIQDGPPLGAWAQHKREILQVLLDGPMLTRDAVRRVPALHTQFYRLVSELVAEGLVDQIRETGRFHGHGDWRGGVRMRWSITPYGVQYLTGRR